MLTRKCHITLIFLCCARIPTDLSEKCEGHQAGFHCFPSLIFHAATPPPSAVLDFLAIEIRHTSRASGRLLGAAGPLAAPLPSVLAEMRQLAL